MQDRKEIFRHRLTMNILGSVTGSQDTHSEMRSIGNTGSIGGQAVRTIAGSNRQAWRGHYNLVGAQGRTQLHENRRGGVRHQNAVTLGKNRGPARPAWGHESQASGCLEPRTKGVTSGRTSQGTTGRTESKPTTTMHLRDGSSWS